MTPVLRATDLRKSFGGVHATRRLSLSVDCGQVVSLIGPNGAGKTTAFNLLTGHISADDGAITLDGLDVTEEPTHVRAMRGMARSFQIAEIFPTRTVKESVTTAALLRCKTLREAEERADSVLEELGLADVANRRPGELSLPSIKLLEFAKCVATDPKVILLDEVMAGLTYAEAQLLISHIARLRDAGAGVLLTEHVLPIVMELSDWVVVLSFGEVIMSGTPSEVQSDPHVKRVYLGE